MEIIDQAKQYRIDALYSGRAHYKAADCAARYSNLLGIPVIITTTLVGTAIFATLSTEPSVGWKIATGLISIIAAVFAALQTFFSFDEKNEKHRTAAGKYSSLRRQLDMFILNLEVNRPKDLSSSIETLKRYSEKLSELGSDSPRIPNFAFTWAAKEIEKDSRELPTSSKLVVGHKKDSP